MSEKQSPRTEMETHLQKLWAKVLNIPLESIGRDDSFLQIGGDSILAIHLINAAYADNIKLAVSDIFDDPRLLALAARATNIQKNDEILNIPPFSLIDKSCRKPLFSQELRRNYDFAENLVFHDSYPCTKLQEGLIALTEKLPGSYVAKFIYRLHPNVDLPRFRGAFEETVRMCPNLRTRCVVAGRAMVQVVIENDIAWEELQSQGLKDFMQSMNSLTMGYGSRLNRYAIVEDNGAVYFAWALHHSIFDGWTMRIMMNVLTSLYEGRIPPNLMPYNRFVEYVTNVDCEAASNYWRTQLQGANRAIFPPFSTSNSGFSSSQTFTRPVELNTASISVTKATIVRAAWALLLARYCDTDDVCFGATTSGRQASIHGLSEMPGPTIATVPIRVQLNKQQTIREYLQRIQTQAAEMVPFEQLGLQEISKLSPEADEACKFSALLVIQPLQHLSDDRDAIMVPVDDDAQADTMLRDYFNYPLVLQGHIDDEHANLVFIYDSKLISEQQIQAMSCQLEHIIRQLVLEQELQLNALPLSCSWDLKFSQQVNDELPEVIHSCIHTLIEHQAEIRANDKAICAWDKELTYGQLNETANRLAHYLIENGVKPHDLVLVCFEKSVWHIVSILAINKAGAAWVPIDPSHPLQRQKQVASQTKAHLTLASENNVETARLLTSKAIVLTPSLDIDLIRKSYNKDNPNLQISPQHAAYVLFTSGSTGMAKGLVMEHGAVCTSQMAISKRLGLDSSIRMLQFASFVFDLSVGEIIAPLLSGACVCVPSEEARLNRLTEFICEVGVNWAILTPSFLRTLQPADVPGLELLLVGGEAVPRDILDSWFGKVRLVLGWGPSETCVYSTLYECISVNDSPSTIGKPVGASCWIVDPEDHSSLAPVGTIGEILIQGPTLLREYLADPDRTNAAIVQSPGWLPLADEIHWDRCYKSGDLGYFNLDGTIEFSTRKDTQIKINGLRIEATEVEFHIQQLL
ncbi:non-ribosomal peptide synthetase, partial [Trichoderma atroviride IMI 206040]